MKKNKLLVLSLLACSLLTGCDSNTFVQNGSNPVGVVSGSGDIKLDTTLTLQKFYENLRTSNGGSMAVDKLLDKIAEIEYSDAVLANALSREFDVKSYHTTASLQKDIAKVFEDVIESDSYKDDDGNFDPEAYKEYVEETLDYEVNEGTTSANYINDEELRKTLKYNYDNYISKSVKPDILGQYIYLDYVTGSSKYKGQFSNQYAVQLEVLKVPHDETKINGTWSESLVKDIKAVTSSKENVTFNTNYSFVTFNANNDMILFETTADTLKYTTYTLTDDQVKTNVPSYIAVNGKEPIRQLDYYNAANKATIDAIVSGATKNDEKSWSIKASEARPNQTYYEHIDEILVARDLWKIDREVILAKNYDNRTTYYEAMTETEKTEAQNFANTYSNSNAKPIKEVAKEKKVSAQKTKYYTAPDYYTRSSYTNVLPTTLSSLRGTSARDLMSHLRTFDNEEISVAENKFLLPTSDSIVDPVYLDTSSNTYYVCEVISWYGYYASVDMLDSSKPSRQVSNYQIEAYQKGVITPWKLNDSKTRFEEDTAAAVEYKTNPEAFKDVIELVQISANNILTESMRKEAVVALFEKYGLEINDQDIYDYISNQYPDYFKED